MQRIGFALGLALLSAVACGGGDDVGGIPPDKQMSDLTVGEATALCKQYESDFNAIYTLPCTAQGLSQGEGAACVTARDACLETASTIDCEGVQDEDLEGCDILVSTVEDCVSEFADFARSVSCEEPPASAITPPPCFSNLRAKCKIFGG